MQRDVGSHNDPEADASKQNHVVVDLHAGDVDATMARHLRREAAFNPLRREYSTAAIGTQLPLREASAAAALAAPHEEVAHVGDSKAATAAQPPCL